MATLVDGGIRRRLISDSLRVMVVSGLKQAGWFEPGRQHKALNYIPRPQDWDSEVKFNSFAINTEDESVNSAGLGGEFEDDIRYYIDLWVEKDSLGFHLGGDVQAILQGQFPSIGRYEPVLPVFDFRESPPSPLGVMDIEMVLFDRPEVFSRTWMRNWFMVSCSVVDEHYDDPSRATWQPEYQDAWDMVKEALYG